MRKRMKGALRKTAAVAGTVEKVSGNVKKAAQAVDRLIPNGNGSHPNGNRYSGKGNTDHRATRAARPSGVIVREHDNALPDMDAKLFVDPLDGNKEVFGESTSIFPAGILGVANYVTERFDNMIFPVYQTAVIQAIRYDSTAVFDLNDFRNYITKMTKALQQYYVIASQRAYLMDGETITEAMNERNKSSLQYRTESALRIVRTSLSNYSFPPHLHAFIRWLAEIHPLGRTPNANLAQFITPDLYLADTDVTISDALTDALVFTDNERIISGVLGKLMPDWRMDIPEYASMPSNPSLDFNWLNIWVNHGFENSPGTIFNPQSSMQYALFNDNPNVVCTASSTLYDPAPASLWQPGILIPDSTNGLVGRINAGGDYAPVVADSDIILGALRYREYNNPPGTFHNAATCSPDAFTVAMDHEDLIIDTTYTMQWFFHTEELADVNQSYLRSRR